MRGGGDESKVYAKLNRTDGVTLPWRGRVDCSCNEQPGRGDSLSISHSLPAERSPHPVTHLASLDCVPAQPLQRRVTPNTSLFFKCDSPAHKGGWSVPLAWPGLSLQSRVEQLAKAF